MNKSSAVVFAAAFVSAMMLLPYEAAAQEKQKAKLDISAAQTKYTYQRVLDVGDLPGIRYACTKSKERSRTQAPSTAEYARWGNRSAVSLTCRTGTANRGDTP